MSPIAYRGAKHREYPQAPPAATLCSHARRSPKKKKEKRPNTLTLAQREIIIYLILQLLFYTLFSLYHSLYITPSGILYLDVGILLAGPSDQDATTDSRIPPS